MTHYTVAALYHFAPIEDLSGRQSDLKALCTQYGVTGTLLLAREGINGTIAADSVGIQAALDHISAWPGFDNLEHKLSHAFEPPFYKMKVKCKREIVTMGIDNVDPNRVVGEYVQPEDWNALISRPDITLVDTRNDYETAIGTFHGAVDPNTRNFREFPEWALANLDPEKPIAMYCTGGIRCEKASSFLKDKGFKQVFHLKGGILKYLEKVKPEESKWEGSCFVFDQRVSIEHGLALGSHELCYACGFPLSAEDKQSPHYIQGVSCHRCHDRYTDERRASFTERQRQIDLARARNQQHIGVAQRHNRKD